MSKIWLVFISSLVLASPSFGHEMTPTYFNFEKSYVKDISVTAIQIFNRRSDTSYYEIDVYDEDWKKVKFASQSKLIEIEYLKKKEIDIYVRDEDLKDVMYICTTSKNLKDEVISTGITSRICSKHKAR